MDAFLMKLNEFSQEHAVTIQLFCLVSLPHALQVTTQNTLSSDGVSGFRAAVSNLPLFPSKPLFFTKFILKYSGLAFENAKINLRLEDYHRALSKKVVSIQK